MTLDTIDICPSHLLRCPEDKSISLVDYLLLSRTDPETDKYVRVPLVGKVWVPQLKRRAPPLSKGVHRVRATVEDFGFGRIYRGSFYVTLGQRFERELSDGELVRLSDSQIIEFDKKNSRVVSHVFRKPLRFSEYEGKFSRAKLKQYYSELFETIGAEVIAGVSREQGFDSIEWVKKQGQRHKYKL